MSHAAGLAGATRVAISKHQSVPCSTYSSRAPRSVNGAAEAPAQLDDDRVAHALERRAVGRLGAAQGAADPRARAPITSCEAQGAAAARWRGSVSAWAAR